MLKSLQLQSHVLSSWVEHEIQPQLGEPRLVESLLRRGADVAARSNDGERALHVVPGGYAELEVRSPQ